MIFDFDGTVAIGDGPIRCYAHQAALMLPEAQQAEFEKTIDLFLKNSGQENQKDSEESYLDGYDRIKSLGEEYGLSAKQLSQAYLNSRTKLATEEAMIESPENLVDFLSSVKSDPKSHLVLATNAPETRINEALTFLGLTELFDEVYTGVGKPDGLYRLLDEYAQSGPVISIGDVWHNDLAPAFERGHDTALIADSNSAPAEATPSYRAEKLVHLYPVLSDWLNN